MGSSHTFTNRKRKGIRIHSSVCPLVTGARLNLYWWKEGATVKDVGRIYVDFVHYRLTPILREDGVEVYSFS
jgi:hypothetical protein